MWWSLPAYRSYDAIIGDGSIRSGKTLSMTVGFVLWSMASFDGQVFALCGKTIEALRRNVVLPMQQWLDGVVTIQEKRSENLIIISLAGRKNRYFLFGGRDESSYALIQGMTLAGVLFDEVALMPRSFVEQALARCSVEGSRFWFNCNPAAPSHWFREEWLLKCEEKNALHLHFTMEDNLSLSDNIRRRYEAMYSGVFYDRYIRGLWVQAEGRVYDMFDKASHVVTQADRPYTAWYISMDYGTQNPTAMQLWGKYGGVWYLENEYYYSGRESKRQKTDEEYYAELEKLVGGRHIKAIIIDPSAASMIACIKKHGKYTVLQADNTVLDGIRNTANALNAGHIKLCENCNHTIKEMESYVWDEKASQRGEDKPLKENDHAMDAMRYFVQTVLQRRKAKAVDRYALGIY